MSLAPRLEGRQDHRDRRRPRLPRPDNGAYGRAPRHAATFGRSLPIEEEIPGHSFRLVYLEGKLIDAIRRDPPALVGDGKRTIRQLMDAETAERLRDTGSFRSLIPLSPDLERTLSLEVQRLTPPSVAARGQRIVVKSVINQNGRSENHPVRARVHPSLERLGSRLVASMGVRLAGLDVITANIGVPLEEGGGVIHEVNAPPRLHYHGLVSDPAKAAPVGERVLDRVLLGSQRRDRG
jgi:D-alanine-D-alanine ligase-like ATP-grasp enzyme